MEQEASNFQFFWLKKWHPTKKSLMYQKEAIGNYEREVNILFTHMYPGRTK